MAGPETVWGRVDRAVKNLRVATQGLYDKIMTAREERKSYENALAALKHVYEGGLSKIKQA